MLALCAEAGWSRVGVIAVDGTKVHANASQHATRDYEQIAREILEEADAVDAEEDERFGDARGDELPAEFATAQGRRGGCATPSAGAWTSAARGRRARSRAAPEAAEGGQAPPGGRPPGPSSTPTPPMRTTAARGRMKNGRRLRAHSPPKPYQPPERPEGKINLTDLDSRNVKTPRGWVQGYNAQAVTTEDQIVIAAEVTIDSPDFGHLEPMIAAARARARRRGRHASARRSCSPTPATGIRSRWSASSATGLQVLDPARRQASARATGRAGTAASTRSCAASWPPTWAASSTRKRQTMIEPVFADTKFNRRSTASYAAAEPPAARNGG